MAGQLNPRQRKFAELYDGNATEAAIKAGYSPKTAAYQAARLLKNVNIQAIIQGREKNESKKRIATRQRRQEFWTETMENGGAEMRDRLKASELLGKSEGDFLERRAGGDAPDSARLLKIEFVSAPSANSGPRPAEGQEETGYSQDER